MNKSEVPHIVICPKSLIYNWKNEVEKFFPELKVEIIDKNINKRKKQIENLKNKKFNLIITSYSILQKDYQLYLNNKCIFDYMILDEAQIIKNIKTISSKAVRVLSANRKIILSGTPLENNLQELFGTFEIIMPNYLGSKQEFKRNFISKIDRNNKIAIDLLKAKINPFILRRRKDDVLKELPAKQLQIVYNEMTNKQVIFYNEILNRVKQELDEAERNNDKKSSSLKVLSALLKLRQICNHPELIDSSISDDEDICGKFEQFKELLREGIESGEKILIFSQFTSMLDIIEKHTKEKKYKYLRLDGQTKDRQKLVDEFNGDDKIKIFLISLKAGGVGLNLTSANTVFIYDPWWNPQSENQAIDRAHRIGQKKSVNVYKFITRNSIEEKILNLQKRKGDLFENILSKDNSFINNLEWEDLMELFE